MNLRKTSTLRNWALASCALSVIAAAPAVAEAKEKFEFDIEQKDLGSALTDYSIATGRQVLFKEVDVRGKKANELEGSYTSVEAVKLLLDDTGVEYRIDANGTLLVGNQFSRRASLSEEAAPAPAIVARAQENSVGASAQNDGREEITEVFEEEAEDEEARQDTITVTGTNIRGVSDQFTPTAVISADEIEIRGFSDVEDILQSLPQTFGGGVNSDNPTGVGGVGASFPNLRGLGSEGTLTLLNGRRIAPAGSRGQGVDLSLIPTSAIERVEVLTDGASAIYGSDAIAGVVNVIMRDDFQGAETRVRVGTLSRGNGDQAQISQTFGAASDRAYGLASYQYTDNNALDAADRDFSDTGQRIDLLPNSRTQSAFLSGGFDFSDKLRASSDMILSDRRSRAFGSNGGNTFLNRSLSRQFGGGLNVEYDWNENWQLRLHGNFSKSELNTRAQLIAATVSDLNEQEVSSEVLSGEALVEGAAFALPGGDARLVIGAGYRDEKADILDFSPRTGTISTEVKDTRTVSTAFGELYLPIVTEANELPLARELSVSLAGRLDDYSDVGSSFNPKVGARWGIIDGLSVRGTYGTSFRAPRLDQAQDFIINSTLFDYAPDSSDFNATIPVLSVFGYSSDISPEESESWSIGADFSPLDSRDLLIRVTYFAIDYEDRLVFPRNNFGPAFQLFDVQGDVLTGVDQATIQDIVSRSARFSNFTSRFGSNSTLDQVSTVIDGSLTNSATTKVSGVDFEVTYAFDLPIGQVSVSADGSYLTEFEEQFSADQPAEDLVDTLFNPADLLMNAGVTWSDGGASIAAFARYVDSYENNRQLSGPTEVDSWTTFDLSARYDFSESQSSGPLSGVVVTANVLNVFDQDPPSIGLTNVFAGAGQSARSFDGFNYDSANANPNGRYVQFQISKRF